MLIEQHRIKCFDLSIHYRLSGHQIWQNQTGQTNYKYLRFFSRKVTSSR